MMPYPYSKEEEEQPADQAQLMDMYGSMAQSGPAATDGFGFTPRRRPMTESLTALQESGAFEPFDARRPVDFAWGTFPTALQATANLTNLERAREEGFGANLEAAGEVVRSHVTEPGSVNYETYLEEIKFPYPKLGAFLMSVIEPGLGEFATAGKAFGGAVMSMAKSAADFITPIAFLLPLRKAFTGGTPHATFVESLAKQTDSQGNVLQIDPEVLREPLLTYAEQNSSIAKSTGTYARRLKDIEDEMHHELWAELARVKADDPKYQAHQLLDPFLQYGQSGGFSDLQMDFYQAHNYQGVLGQNTPEYDILRAYTDAGHSGQYLGVPTGNISVNAKNALGLRAVSDTGMQYLEQISGRWDPSLYVVMNSILRRGLNVVRGEMSPRDFGAMTEAIQLFDAAFDGRFVTGVPAVGYRGTVINAQWLPVDVSNDPSALIGQTILDSAYSSFSDSVNAAFSFLRTKNYRPKGPDDVGIVFQIEIPTGSPVIPLQNVSTYASESEILLPRGVGIKILNVEDRGSYIFALGEPDFSMSPAVQKRQGP